MSHLDETAHYTIRIEGAVDAAQATWFGPVEITHAAGPGGQLVTTLAGAVADQAALVGLVRYLHGLGLVLLSVERDLYGATK